MGVAIVAAAARFLLFGEKAEELSEEKEEEEEEAGDSVRDEERFDRGDATAELVIVTATAVTSAESIRSGKLRRAREPLIR